MEKYEININRLGINGEGIGYLNNKVVFVDGVIPGEKVIIKLVEEQKNFFKGKLIEILVASDKRDKPLCPYYDDCGGCQLQHITYDDQLMFKKNLIIQALNKYAKIDYKISILNTEGMDNPYNYRNRAQMPLGTDKNRRVKTGFYQANSNKLVFIDKCIIHKDKTNKIISDLVYLINKSKIKVFDSKNKNGILKYVSVRENNKNQIMVTVVFTKGSKEVDLLCKNIAKISGVDSVYKNINDGKNNEIVTDKLNYISGLKTINETIGKLSFTLLPNTFLQLNTIQTEKLYNYVSSLIPHEKRYKILDAFCGVGTIGQWISSKALEVRGIDINKSSIKTARSNCEINNITNCFYSVGKVETKIKEYFNDDFIPDIVIFDPPRTGLRKDTIDLLNKYKIKKIIYISCNPSTLAKNIRDLKSNYKVISIKPFDMFPQTSHTESVTLLELK